MSRSLPPERTASSSMPNAAALMTLMAPGKRAAAADAAAVLRGELISVVEFEFARSITEGTTWVLCGELSSEGKKLEPSACCLMVLAQQIYRFVLALASHCCHVQLRQRMRTD